MKKLLAPLFIAGTVSLLLPENAAGEIYKCKDAFGQLIFSDKKCGDTPEVVRVEKHKQSAQPASRPFYCPSGISAAVNNLHYPTLKDVSEAVRLVESDHANLRYRKLIKQVDPEDVLPEKVSIIRAEAFPASEVPGFSNGVVVNVRICK